VSKGSKGSKGSKRRPGGDDAYRANHDRVFGGDHECPHCKGSGCDIRCDEGNCTVCDGTGRVANPIDMENIHE